MTDARAHDEPVDRATRLAGRALEAIEAAPEYVEGIHAIVLIDDGDKGGNALLRVRGRPRRRRRLAARTLGRYVKFTAFRSRSPLCGGDE